jgi:hypothetical protein
MTQQQATHRSLKEHQQMTKNIKAGATATEKTRNVKLAVGGKTRMFGEQEAETPKRPGITGKVDSRGPGRATALGGYGTPGGKSKIGAAAPAEPGRTGNVHGSKPRPR